MTKKTLYVDDDDDDEICQKKDNAFLFNTFASHQMLVKTYLIKENSDETSQRSLLYVFALILALTVQKTQ